LRNPCGLQLLSQQLRFKRFDTVLESGSWSVILIETKTAKRRKVLLLRAKCQTFVNDLLYQNYSAGPKNYVCAPRANV